MPELLIPTEEEAARMKGSGLKTEAEQQAWLKGARRLIPDVELSNESISDGPLAGHVGTLAREEVTRYLGNHFNTIAEKRAFLMGKLNVRGGIAR